MVSEIKADKLTNQSGDQDTSVDLSTNDVVKIDTAGSTKVTVDADGSVGIGVADGDVTSDGTAARTYVGIIGTANRGRLNIGSTAHNGADGGVVSFVNGANELGNIYMDSNSGSQTSGKMYITSTDVVKLSASITSGYALTIEATGNSGTPETLLLDTPNYTKDSTGGHFLKCDDSTATRCVIDMNGSLRNHDNSYGSLSDERIKQDIKDANSQWDDIKAVKVRKYKKKDDVAQYKDKAWEQIGVVAQELEASGMDKLVDIDNESEEKWKSVKYSVLYMKAVKALQEAMTRIETLETKVKALEAK